MTANRTHLYNLRTLSNKEEEIIRKVNNTNVIQCIKFPQIENSEYNIINYVKELVAFWNNRFYNIKKNHIDIFSSTKNTIDFNMAKKEISKELRTLDKKYKLPVKPSGALIIKYLRKMYLSNEITAFTLYTLLDLLTTKNRHHSGVLEIAIMTGPGEFSCKYDCHYCPNQKGIARSYIKEEPAVRRAAQNDFDCVKQINARISSYLSIGQPGDKGEIIILGGTFSNYSDQYREEFMRDLYYACNTYYDEDKRTRGSLEEEKNINENTLFKVIGLTVETRPDCIDEAEIKRYIKYGVTRVQLGVQHTNDNLLKKINRKCYTEDTRRALKLLKEAGFKIMCHYMPNLPDATPDDDINLFYDVIYDPSLICDEWKIYPTSVTTTSEKDIEDVVTVIEKWYHKGEYTPYPYEDLEEVIRYAKKHCPKYIRISRIFRDIPVNNIIAGADIPHMRQKIQKKMALDGEYCQCIRCREIKNRNIDINRIKYTTEKYEAQEGTEYFISANYDNAIENVSYLVGFCRLRVNNTEVGLDYLPYLKDSSIVRELHVYGKMVPSYLSKILISNTQHKGIGTKLMRIAENITKKQGLYKISVISGAGVRGFYRKKLGYQLEGGYMVKTFYNEFYLINIIYLLFLGCMLFTYFMILYDMYRSVSSGTYNTIMSNFDTLFEEYNNNEFEYMSLEF